MQGVWRFVFDACQAYGGLVTQLNGQFWLREPPLHCVGCKLQTLPALLSTSSCLHCTVLQFSQGLLAPTGKGSALSGQTLQTLHDLCHCPFFSCVHCVCSCALFVCTATMLPGGLAAWAPTAQAATGCTVGCFAKSTFQQKIKGIPSRIPPGCI